MDLPGPLTSLCLFPYLQVGMLKLHTMVIVRLNQGTARGDTLRGCDDMALPSSVLRALVGPGGKHWGPRVPGRPVSSLDHQACPKTGQPLTPPKGEAQWPMLPPSLSA